MSNENKTLKKPKKIKSNTHSKVPERKLSKGLLLKIFPVLCDKKINSLTQKKKLSNHLHSSDYTNN